MRVKKFFLVLTLVFMSCLLFSTCTHTRVTIPPPDNGGNDEENNPPLALMSLSPMERAFTQGQNVIFDGTDSMDPDANTLTYEWDFHFADNVFDIEANGPNLTYSLPSFGSVVAALRVTDSGNPPLSSLVRKRLNVKPSGEIANVTKGAIDDIMLRRAVESGGDFYVLYTGESGAYVQRSSDAGGTWCEPILISSIPEDRGPLGIWMDSAPFGIVLAWMGGNGTVIKYASGKPSGTNSITFSSPTTLQTFLPVIMDLPVLYSIACTPAGDWIYIVYMTSGAYEVMLITAKLDSSGAVTEHNQFTVALDNDDRRRFSGVGVTSGPTGRGFVTYVWKSLGYDNEDSVLLYYFTPPVTALEGPVRVDVGLTGFTFDHDPYVLVNNDDEPIVYFRTTGIFQGGKDIALCISDGNPPVFRETIRGNNTVGGSELAAQNSPSLAYDRDHGQLWLAFEDFRDKDKISQIYVSMFDNQYSTILPDFDISNDADLIYSDINPQICYKGGTQPTVVVLWERDGTDIVAYQASYQ